jgi:hypothetical protein
MVVGKNLQPVQITSFLEFYTSIIIIVIITTMGCILYRYIILSIAVVVKYIYLVNCNNSNDIGEIFARVVASPRHTEIYKIL